ncbi:MAG: hypothetical protein AAFV59_08660 [Pseudomonadota bacterium]
MSTNTDLTIPLSALSFQSDDAATAVAADWDTTQIGVLLQAVIERHALAQLDDQSVHFVSVTYDVSAQSAAGEGVQFSSRIDRKTRTLIFASGTANQGARHLLKATVVFRIA